MRRLFVSMLALGAGLGVFSSSAPAPARPGGGQSFRSGSSSSSGSSWSSSGSSRSSSGSSWGSSGSSTSGSGSWWNSGSSTRSPSTSTGSSYEAPGTTGGGISEEEIARIQSYSHCIMACTATPDMSSCMSECERARDAPPVAKPDSESDSRPTPAPVVEPEKPLSRFFWIPGFALGLVAVGGLVRHLQKKREEAFWSSANAELDRELAFRQEQDLARRRHPTIMAALAALRSKDQGFSWVLFEDFAHALYVEAQRLRGGNRLELLSPYLTDAARAAYAPHPADEVEAIVVGGLETQSIVIDEAARKLRVSLAFDANYTEVRAGKAQSFYARELWTLVRGADISSRPPKRARTLDCPSCGAPLEKMMGETCAHCGAPAAAGSRDWAVEAIQIEARELRGPMLTGTTEEEGTSLPTLVAPDVKQAFAELTERDPAFDWASFVKRVELVFHTFHRAWSAQELAPVRQLLSDALFETQSYWVAAYKAQQLRNVTEDQVVVSVALSRIVRDKYYDAITVRVFAECKDYTLDISGHVVGGSREQTRKYSEYWTFIRSAARSGAPGTELKCPNCGAPAPEIDVAGTCSSCQVKVTSGEFDWTLSRIEQDEVYRL